MQIFLVFVAFFFCLLLLLLLLRWSRFVAAIFFRPATSGWFVGFFKK
jgi:hypothetical protein